MKEILLTTVNVVQKNRFHDEGFGDKGDGELEGCVAPSAFVEIQTGCVRIIQKNFSIDVSFCFQNWPENERKENLVSCTQKM